MSKKMVIIIAACGLLLIGGIGGGFFMIWSKLSSLGVTPETKAAAETKTAPERPGVLFPLDTFIVNLADSGGTRYLRVALELEAGGDIVVQEIKTRVPLIRDAVLMILPTKRYDDINTVAGKNSLRQEIMTELNALLKKGGIRNIFFTEFVVQ